MLSGMKELTPGQIAMAVMGHPFSGVPELRLLRLYHAEPSDSKATDATERTTAPVPIARAA